MERPVKCQCGGTPRWYVCAGIRHGKRTRRIAERLRCPACGNQTSSGHSRGATTRKWNSAGWCGQAEIYGLENRVRIPSTPRDAESPFEGFEKEGGGK